MTSKWKVNRRCRRDVTMARGNPVVGKVFFTVHLISMGRCRSFWFPLKYHAVHESNKFISYSYGIMVLLVGCRNCFEKRSGLKFYRIMQEETRRRQRLQVINKKHCSRTQWPVCRGTLHQVGLPRIFMELNVYFTKLNQSMCNGYHMI